MFEEALRHRRRPLPYLRRPSYGFEHLIDSGAYEAWTSGIAIDREAYCQFALQNRDLAPNVVIVSLDHIDPDDPGESARISFENFEYLRSRGLDPMPVVHVGESLDCLRRYF